MIEKWGWLIEWMTGLGFTIWDTRPLDWPTGITGEGMAAASRAKFAPPTKMRVGFYIEPSHSLIPTTPEGCVGQNIPFISKPKLFSAFFPSWLAPTPTLPTSSVVSNEGQVGGVSGSAWKPRNRDKSAWPQRMEKIEAGGGRESKRLKVFQAKVTMYAKA